MDAEVFWIARSGAAFTGVGSSSWRGSPGSAGLGGVDGSPPLPSETMVTRLWISARPAAIGSSTVTTKLAVPEAPAASAPTASVQVEPALAPGVQVQPLPV